MIRSRHPCFVALAWSEAGKIPLHLHCAGDDEPSTLGDLHLHSAAPPPGGGGTGRSVRRGYSLAERLPPLSRAASTLSRCRARLCRWLSIASVQGLPTLLPLPRAALPLSSLLSSTVHAVLHALPGGVWVQVRSHCTSLREPRPIVIGPQHLAPGRSATVSRPNIVHTALQHAAQAELSRPRALGDRYASPADHQYGAECVPHASIVRSERAAYRFSCFIRSTTMYNWRSWLSLTTLSLSLARSRGERRMRPDPLRGRAALPGA